MAPHLESLPTEILNSCFTHLIPPRVPTEATPRTLKQVTFDIHTGYNGKRRALRSLCLTSRRLNAIARACLYRNLGVITGKQIVLLLRSLWNNFELRNLPRSFACPTLLTEDELVISTANHYSLVHKELHRDLDDPVNHGILPENLLPNVDQILPSLSDPTSATRIIIRRRNLPHRGLPQELVARILDRLYRVEDVLVQFPRHRKPEYSIRIPYDPKYTLFELRSWFGRIWSARAGHGPYPTIKSFRIQQAVLPVCFMRTGMDHLDGPFWKTLCGVEVFECDGDDGFWKNLLDNRTDEWTEVQKQTWYSSKKDLRLYRSRTLPSSIYHLLKRCHNLRSFHWTFDKHEWRLAGEIAENPDVSLNDALLQGADKLESLHLESFGSFSRGNYPPYPFEVITCLPRFQNLRSLTIDTWGLWGLDIVSTEIEAGIPFTALLPPCLNQFQLIERWSRPQYKAYRTDLGMEMYNSWLRKILDQSSKECNARLPKLRTFTFLADPEFRPGWEQYGLEKGGVPDSGLIGEGLERIKQSFKSVGVDMFWEWPERDFVTNGRIWLTKLRKI